LKEKLWRRQFFPPDKYIRPTEPSSIKSLLRSLLVKRISNSALLLLACLFCAIPAGAGTVDKDLPKDLAVLKPQPAEKELFPGHTTAPNKPGEFLLPLKMTEYRGQGGPRFVSFGVPLLPAQEKDPANLGLVEKSPDGSLKTIPAQFRVLARWWRADNSIRWVLVDFKTSMGNHQVKEIFLTNKKLPAAAPPRSIKVEESAKTISVNTGSVRFDIDRKNFNLFQHVYFDENKDGKFTAEEDLLAASSENGIVLTDTHGVRYLSSAGTSDVRVIESGPMRVRVRARGINLAPDNKGYSKGLYQFDVFMDFYAGSGDVKLDLILGNNSAAGIGTPTFKDASLWLKLAGGCERYRIYGQAPLDGQLKGDSSVCLYQDSNGAETWRQARGHYGADTSSFRGYKVFFRTPSGGWKTKHVSHGGYGVWETSEAGAAKVLHQTLMTQGGQARGLAQLKTAKGGLIIHTPNFWQQFPKGVELFADGRARLALMPGEGKLPHFFEDASGKGHSIILHFYNLKVKSGYAAQRGHTWAHVLADCWDNPVFPIPSMKHKAATGALTDLGSYTVPTKGFITWPREVHYRRMLMTDRYWGNGFGWQVFGSRWQAHGGHSSRGARQPIKEDAWLYRFYTMNDPNWFLYGEARSRHFRDIRCYRIEGQDPFGFANWDEFSKHNRSEDYTRRTPKTGADYSKYTAGLWKRSTWWLPNPAHLTLDLIYDRYLLFGDQRALENMRVVAANGGYFTGYRKPYIHRQTGWPLRACLRYWELTGDKDAARLLATIISNYKGMIGNPPLVCGHKGKTNWWFTQVFSRGMALTALYTLDPQALEFCKTMAIGKESRAEYFCTLFATLYHLTGEDKYKQAILKKTGANGKKLLIVNTNGDFPATAHWLINQPPRKGK
jgi:PcRGLX-like protein central beta sandwich domain